MDGNWKKVNSNQVNHNGMLVSTNPESQVDLRIPFRVLLIPNDLCPSLVASIVDSAIRIHKLLLDTSHSKELLHLVKVARIHLWHVLSPEDAEDEGGGNQAHSRGPQQVPACGGGGGGGGGGG